MAAELREKIWRAILSLSPNCSVEEARVELDPLLQLAAPLHEVEFEIGITPLIVACDVGNSSCLEYLWEKTSSNETLMKFIGSPMDVSDDNKNSAMHHAAMAGCNSAIQILRNFGESVFSLASVRNSHFDTPFMLAAVNGRFEFVRTLHRLLVEEEGVESAQNVLRMKNNSHDSCLSLACSHGQLPITQLFLQWVPAEIDELQICRPRFELMRSMVRKKPEMFSSARLDTVRQCIDALEASLAHQAEENARKLLAEEVSPTNDNSIAKRNRKKKKKKNHLKNEVNMQEKEDTDVTRPVDDGHETEKVNLTRLADGTPAVVVTGEELGKPQLRLPASLIAEDRSIEDMFRMRLEGGSREGGSAEVEATMDALCLDASMLLYTPHGMALNLSPSQLDVVENVLQKQLVAVREARGIKSRMHCGNRS
eukprot:scaffold22589_cov138-Cylindrotheca_fusiformis.AAC.27